MRALTIAYAIFVLACGSAHMPWPKYMPVPRNDPSVGFRVYVWNNGLGELRVQSTGGGGAIHLLPGESGILVLYSQDYQQLVYDIEGRRFVTASPFKPSSYEPCWQMTVSPDPANDQVNPVPVECP